jgi:hypothetical protein
MHAFMGFTLGRPNAKVARSVMFKSRTAKAAFDAMEHAFKGLPYIRVLRAVNCNPEILARMERRFDWSDIISELDMKRITY